MRSGETRSGARRWLGPALVAAAGTAAAGAVATALSAQHRAVRRALGEARAGADAEQLQFPHDVVRHQVVTDDGASLAVVERGQGPALLLLHGMLLSSEIWVHQFTDLADRHRVVAVDLRGHGRSTAGERPLDLETMAGDVRRVVEELGLAGCLLVGHSLGGMVALRLAQDLADPGAPQLFGGVVMVASAAGPFVKVPGWRAVTEAGAPAWTRLALLSEMAGARATAAEDLRWWLVRIGFGPEAVPAQVRFVEQVQAATPAGTLGRLLPVVAGVDLSVRLGAVELPVLVIAGTHDRLVGLRHARRTAHTLAHGQLVELARCGHMPMLERRREFSRLLDEFCEKVS